LRAGGLRSFTFTSSEVASFQSIHHSDVP
jgi:hypothetical protein